MQYVPATSASAPVPKVPLPFTIDDLKQLYLPGFSVTTRTALRHPEKGERSFEGRFEILKRTPTGFVKRVRSFDFVVTKEYETKEHEHEWTLFARRQILMPARTLVGEQTISVPAGSFRCKVYHVPADPTDDERMRGAETIYYAIEHPGLEVLQIHENLFGMSWRTELIALQLGKP